MRLEPFEYARSTRVEGAIDVHEKLTMFWHREARQRVIEETHLERNAIIRNLRRRAIDIEGARWIVRPPTLRKPFKAVESDEARTRPREILDPPTKRPPLPDSELQIQRV